MMPTLRSEFRKLFTIRSTYIITGLALLLLGFISFWVLGYRGDPLNPNALMEVAITAGQATSLFATIIAVLLITHEYRYNTIMYTLTASNSRSKVLLSKLLVVTAYVLSFTVLAVLFAVGLALLGMEIKGGEFVTQQFYYADVLWRLVFYMWAYAITGLLLGVLFRHVVGAIVTLFLMPTTVEPLLGLLLKDNSKYLPFSSLEHVLGGSMVQSTFTHGEAAALFGAYLAVGWLVAWVLYVKRDAN